MATRRPRTTRLTGDERQEAILITAEALLAERSLDEISIEDLARGAGISRPSFYFYFPSKDDVLLALLERVIREVHRRVATLPRDFDTDHEGAWRRAIGVFVDVFTAHRAVSTAAISARLRNPEVNDLWSAAMQTWVGYATDVIVAERARGAAPGGSGARGSNARGSGARGLNAQVTDARNLAIALNLMNERVLTAAFNGETPAIDQSAALDVLAGIWIRSIYS